MFERGRMGRSPGRSPTASDTACAPPVARMPDPEEVENLTRAIEDNVEPGQGFEIGTAEIDDWLGVYEVEDDP